MVDELGDSVVGARVTITTPAYRDYHYRGPVHGTTTTDESGRFRFDLVSVKGFSVTVDPVDKALVCVNRWLQAPFDPQLLIIAHEGREISGRVFWPDGEDASSVRVYLRRAGYNERLALRCATSRADGVFRLLRVPPGRYELNVSQDWVVGGESDGERAVEVERTVPDIGAGESGVEIHLEIR